MAPEQYSSCLELLQHLAESDAFTVACQLGRRRPGLTHLFLFLFPTTAPYRREITCTFFSSLKRKKKKKIPFACQELFVRFTELVVECWTFFKCPKDSGETEAAGAGACLELSLPPCLGEDQWWASGLVSDRSCSHCKETWGGDREVGQQHVSSDGRPLGKMELFGPQEEELSSLLNSPD